MGFAHPIRWRASPPDLPRYFHIKEEKRASVGTANRVAQANGAGLQDRGAPAAVAAHGVVGPCAHGFFHAGTGCTNGCEFYNGPTNADRMVAQS